MAAPVDGHAEEPGVQLDRVEGVVGADSHRLAAHRVALGHRWQFDLQPLAVGQAKRLLGRAQRPLLQARQDAGQHRRVAGVVAEARLRFVGGMDPVPVQRRAVGLRGPDGGQARLVDDLQHRRVLEVGAPGRLVEVAHADAQQAAAAVGVVERHHGAAGAEVDRHVARADIACGVAGDQAQILEPGHIVAPQLPQALVRVGVLHRLQAGQAAGGVVEAGQEGERIGLDAGLAIGAQQMEPGLPQGAHQLSGVDALPSGVGCEAGIAIRTDQLPRARRKVGQHAVDARVGPMVVAGEDAAALLAAHSPAAIVDVTTAHHGEPYVIAIQTIRLALAVWVSTGLGKGFKIILGG